MSTKLIINTGKGLLENFDKNVRHVYDHKLLRLKGNIVTTYLYKCISKSEERFQFFYLILIYVTSIALYFLAFYIHHAYLTVASFTSYH